VSTDNEYHARGVPEDLVRFDRGQNLSK
jgi:hypothetical protein